MEYSNWQQVETKLEQAQVSLESSARLVQDSRNVVAGDVFVALKGIEQDGAAYVTKAFQSGAVAALVSSNCDKSLYQDSEQVVVIDELESRLAEIAKNFYLKGRTVPMPIIGVTGTNGKTSVSHLLAQLSHICLQQEAAVIGTMGAGSINALEATSNTTPGVTEIYRLVREFSEQGFGSMTMEVSSHALDQGRIEGLDIDVAIFTNLTLDHLDYHGDMESYFQAKAKLFSDYSPKCAVINLDDEYGERLAEQVSENTRVIAYGQSEKVRAYSDYVFIKSFECHSKGLVLELECQVIGAKEQTQLLLPIYGEFNGSNISAVYATALALNWPIQAIQFSQLSAVPGRLEMFVAQDHPVAIVDYAHTPDALEQSLKAVRKHLSGELYVIFGCGGDRDTSKRPIMGKIAESWADHIIITNDNPRSEEPEQIVKDIEQGIGDTAYQIIYDRKRAIQFALSQATAEDAILIAGKGHETYQVIGEDIINYDERDFVKNQMKLLSGQEQAGVQHD